MCTTKKTRSIVAAKKQKKRANREVDGTENRVKESIYHGTRKLETLAAVYNSQVAVRSANERIDDFVQALRGRLISVVKRRGVESIVVAVHRYRSIGHALTRGESRLFDSSEQQFNQRTNFINPTAISRQGLEECHIRRRG